MKSQAEMFMKCCSFGNPKLNDSRSWRKLAEKWVEIVEPSLTHTKQHVVTVNIYIINCLFVAKNGQCDYSNMNIVARCTIRNTVEPHNFSSTKKHTHARARTRCPRLMTFREQPTILFVPLECRYVTAASAAALQPDARATKLPETMSEREREKGWEERHRKMGKRKKLQPIKLRLKGQQVLIMEAKLREMAG